MAETCSQIAPDKTPTREALAQLPVASREFYTHASCAAPASPNKYSSSAEQGDHVKLELKSGKIPQELYEEWRLVEPKSPEGIAFQQHVEKLARHLFTDKNVVADRNKTLERHAQLFTHDFDKEPIRFLISKIEEPNAWFVKDASPGIVVLTEGLFKPNKKSGVVPIQCEEDLLIVIGHEITHAKLKATLGRGDNSKPEEALCDAIPMRLLHYIGRDPSTILSFDERLRGDRKQRTTWYEIADAHLSGAPRQSLYEAALTELGLSLGGVSEASGVRTRLGEEIPMAVFQGVHSSFLEGLKSSSGYEALSSKEKAAFIFETLRTVGSDFPVRFGDLWKAFRGLDLTLDRSIDRSAIIRWVDCLYEFSMSDRGGSRSGISGHEVVASMYEALSRATGSGDKIRPLTPGLRKISAAMKAIIDAVEERNYGALRTSCRDLVLLYRNTRWCRSHAGIELLRTISWPTFGFSDLAKVVKNDELELSWEYLAARADQHEEIAFAGVIMGMCPDPRIYYAAKGHLSSPGSISVEELIASGGNRRMLAINLGWKDLNGCAIPKYAWFTKSERYFSCLLDVKAQISAEYLQQAVCEALLSSGHQLQQGEATPDTLPAEHQCCLAGVTQEEAMEILRLEGISAAQVLLDLLKTPNGWCDENILRKIIAHAEFVVSSDKVPEEAEVSSSSAPERNTLEFIKALSGIRSSNPSLYNLVVGKLWCGYLQLYLINYVEDEDSFGEELVLDSALKAFMRQIAPDLSDECLFRVLCNAGSSDAPTLSVPDAIRDIAEERFKYPREEETTPSALRDWVAKHQQALDSPGLDDWVRVAGKSGLWSLCTLDLQGLLSNETLTGSDLLAIAETAAMLTAEIQLLARDEQQDLREDVARIDYTSTGDDPRDLAKAWRLLYSNGLMTPSFEKSCLLFILKRCAALEAGSPERSQAVQTLLAGSRIRQAHLRDRVISLWIDDALHDLGLDDSSAEYPEKLESRLRAIMGTGIAAVDLKDIGEKLANAVVSQREVSMRIESLCASSDSLGSKTLWASGTVVESVLLVVRCHEAERNAFLKFLLGDDVASVKMDLVDQISHLVTGLDDRVSEKEAKTSTADALKVIHVEFWRLSLEGRAVLAKELLPLEARASIDRSLDFVIEQVLPTSMAYFAETRDLLKRYIHALPDHAQELALAALLTAAEPGASETSSAGAILAKFAESQGPAEIKLVQVLMDAPGLPDNFRRDLISNAGHLKYKTQAPSRAQIFRHLDMIEKRDGETFGYIGPLRGCGSMNIVVEIAGELLCLRRPNCQARAEDGFDIMLRMLESMPANDPIAHALRPIICEARERAALETNFLIAKEQYDRGGSNYRGYSALVDGKRVFLDAAQVSRSGHDYFTMTEMQGEHFVTLLDRKPQDAHVRRIAKVILAREFNAIFRGNFDCDRHGGQIAVGKKIGHFDFKAMALDSWSVDDHRQLVRVLVSTAMGCSSVADLAPHLVNTLQQMRLEGVQISKMVTEGQKAVLSLGDYFKALEPLNRNELIQIVLSGMSNEMPYGLCKLYAAELATFALPYIKKGAGEFGRFVTQQLLEGLFVDLLNGNRLPAAVLQHLPESIRELLPDPEAQIRFEKV